MTEAAGTVHAGSAEIKANDVHATGDAMGVVAQAFPLLWPLCGGQMRIIAFITHSADIRHILEHTGVDSEPPRIKPARGPPL